MVKNNLFLCSKKRVDTQQISYQNEPVSLFSPNTATSSLYKVETRKKCLIKTNFNSSELLKIQEQVY